MSAKPNLLPWEYVGPYVRDAEGMEVCRLPLWRDSRKAEGPLLAAAPDFYEAVNGQPDDVSPIVGLIALTRHYEELLRKSVVAGEEQDPLACYEALSEVEALIARLQIATAKAQGNQP